MKRIKNLIRRIRLKINKIGSSNRRKQILHKEITIISNNCYSGITYEYLGLKFNSPTIGLYFFAEEYIKFLKNLKRYLTVELKEIKPIESRYYKELIKLSQETAILGQLDDVEIVFLHYNSFQEAKEKWDRRKKRVNFDKLIVKFNDQNLCNDMVIKEFCKLPYKNKICFVAKALPYKECVFLKKYRGKSFVKDDIYHSRKYFDIIDYINHIR